MKKTHQDDCPLVLIEWLDSVRPSPGWEFLHEFKCGEAINCVSVGWLVHDDEDIKALAPNMGHINGTNAQASGILRIPTCAITNTTRLKEIT